MYLETLFSLKGKTALVTGGSAGIGQVVARGLARAGATVALMARTDSRRTVELIRQDRSECFAVVADVSNETQVESALQHVVQYTGSLDVVFNNAGICLHKSALDATVEEWRQIIDVNLTGEYIVARAAARHMIELKKHGSIINMASMSGSIVNVPQWQASYNASKAGVIHMTRSLAMEWVEFGIRVNAISPGYIATPISTETPKELKDAWMPRIPMHRMGEPEELIGAILYLASDASTYTTGSDLIVDGGYVCI